MVHNPMSRDETYYTFITGEKFIREVKESRVTWVQSLIDRGIFKDLESKGYIPKTVIEISGNKLFLMQKRILHSDAPPYQCPSIIVSSSEKLLLINSYLNEHGLVLRDPHRSNFVMENNTSKLVDLGSIENLTHDGDLTIDYLLKCYVYPIALFNSGKFYQYKNCSLSDDLPDLKEVCSVVYKNPLIRWVYDKLHRFSIANSYRVSTKLKVNHKFITKVQSICRLYLKKKYNTLIKVKQHKNGSFWSNYQSNSKKTDPRYQNVLKILQTEIDIGSTILEIAGNQGKFSALVADNFPTVKICCSDYDLLATEKAYENLSKYRNTSVLWLDVFRNDGRIYDGPLSERIKSDTIIALALVHHLVLSQGLTFVQVFKRIAQFTKRNLIIDFMPMGLFDGEVSPATPNWYTLENFIEAAQNAGFKKVSEHETGTNRTTVVFRVEQ